VFFVLLTIFLALSAGPLFARDVAITVVDSDLNIPLEGALIRSRDGTEYLCDEEGRALVAVPGESHGALHIAYPGYESRRVTVPPGVSELTAKLRLGGAGVLENRELVVEASRPEAEESKTGRSTAIAGRELTGTAEIGVVEDVMTSVKLLPGVGYAGFFDAQPSIRGGEPGDLTAVMDGFYVERPYHWGGGYSIFDPKMVENVRLSHGIFSVRYGHTISGLLDISARKPSPTETELDFSIGTNSSSLSISLPILGKGGIMLMGKATYLDGVVWAAKELSKAVDNEVIDMVNTITVAPYIRSGALSANYRFTSDLEAAGSGYIGTDGIGILYENDYEEPGLESDSSLKFDWTNTLGFFTAALIFNPLPSMVLKARAGAGFYRSRYEAEIVDDVSVWYSDDFLKNYGPGGVFPLLREEDMLRDGEGRAYYRLSNRDSAAFVSTDSNYQGRLDYDWDLGRGFLFAAGFQELYAQYNYREDNHILAEDPPDPASSLPIKTHPVDFSADITKNRTFKSSAYTLLEYSTGDKFFAAELGVRVDHLYFMGKDFSLQTAPTVNPRLNLDFGVLKNRSYIDSLGLSLGTGLFSSANDTLQFLGDDFQAADATIKQNRSWTSVAGVGIEFTGGISFNLEAYYKYVFDRNYAFAEIRDTSLEPVIYSNGQGHVWGFDLILRKLESRYWDGWISYSFNYARYRDPESVSGALSVNGGEVSGGEWYWPSFHRFHNLNLVLNIKPSPRFNIAARFGFASGAPKPKAGDISSYPVAAWDESGNTIIIEKWKRTAVYDDNQRTTWSLPMAVKFSIYRFGRESRVQQEIYVAIENLLSLVYTSQANTSFNSYTGREDTGSNAASYELSFPVPSFGIKWSY
jgi:hypothetical protein